MAEQQNQGGIGLHILLAEDNKMNQIVAKKLMDKLGCSYVIANNGVECLGILEAGHFDLILMDCMMPEMDGLEATRRIRASGSNYASIPIIAFTANAMPSERQDCLDAGMDDYIDKPVDLDRITNLLKEWAARLRD